MTQNDELLLIAKLGRAHGVHGEIRFFPIDETSTTLGSVKKLWLGRDDNEPKQAYAIEWAKAMGRFFAVKLKGVDDRDLAMSMTGLLAYIPRAALPKLKSQFYAHELLGFALIDENGKVWGRVLDVDSALASDIIIYARPTGGEGMLPWVDYYVQDVELEKKQIGVRADTMPQIDEVYDI
ncbi:MAG: ribosome maturation factor RimM [Bradymonadales bacterium]